MTLLKWLTFLLGSLTVTLTVLLIETVFVIIWEMFHERIFLNSAFLLLLVNFVGWFSLELMLIFLIVNIRTNLTHIYWFSTVRTAAIFHKNYFFLLYQQNKYSESKVKLGQANNCCKRVLEVTKFAYANKTRESINLTVGTFGKLLIVFSIKVNLLYLLYSTAERRCLLHLIKQNCFLKNSTLYLVYLLYLERICNCIIIL